MGWTSLLDPERLTTDVLVGATAGLLLSLAFGLNRRLVLAVVALCFGVNMLYPGGSPALVSDIMRPLRSIENDTTARTAVRNNHVDEAAGDRAPAR